MSIDKVTVNYRWMPGEVLQLINLVKENPSIYNPKDKYYFCRPFVENIWREIDIKLKKNPGSSLAKWTNLRICFRREYATFMVDYIKPPWTYFDSMFFLYPYLRSRKRSCPERLDQHIQEALYQMNSITKSNIRNYVKSIESIESCDEPESYDDSQSHELNSEDDECLLYDNNLMIKEEILEEISFNADDDDDDDEEENAKQKILSNSNNMASVLAASSSSSSSESQIYEFDGKKKISKRKRQESEKSIDIDDDNRQECGGAVATTAATITTTTTTNQNTEQQLDKICNNNIPETFTIANEKKVLNRIKSRGNRNSNNRYQNIDTVMKNQQNSVASGADAILNNVLTNEKKFQDSRKSSRSGGLGLTGTDGKLFLSGIGQTERTKSSSIINDYCEGENHVSSNGGLCDCKIDPDAMFLMSLLPDIRSLSRKDKGTFKIEVQKLVQSLLYPESN